MTDREIFLLLHLTCDLGVRRLKRLLDLFETPRHLLDADEPALAEAGGLRPEAAARLAQARHQSARLADELERAEQERIRILLWGDADYPPILETIADPPLALYVKGNATVLSAPSAAVVGTRRASLYGLRCAEQLAYDLADRGFCIASGLAKGIDAAAHRGALKARGNTVAVLGSGLCRVYPSENRKLAEEIAARGAVISEFPLAAEPEPYHFPRRNRIISGLSRVVIVVEASDRSGAILTADYGLDQGREIFAVPGPIDSPNSSGTHRLIKEGARLLTGVEDVLYALNVPDPANKSASSSEAAAASPEALSATERKVLAAIAKDEATDIDTLAARTEFSIAVLAAPLLRLEMKRLIRQLPGRCFVRAAG